MNKQNIIAEYMCRICEVLSGGSATEHSYRPALKDLFEGMADDVTAINEPQGVAVGRPDFVFVRGKDRITIGHCECKNINIPIDPKTFDKTNAQQFARYRGGFVNLIYTNGLDFHFFRQGECIGKACIGHYHMGRIQAQPDQYQVLANSLKDFAAERLQTITSADVLARRMAGKARVMKDVLFAILQCDEDVNSSLKAQYEIFQDQLIHNLSKQDFADIYAETIAYGMFAARLHDSTLENFSRQEALQLLPKSNPFLRHLFSYIAGPDLHEGLTRTLDELAEIFQASNPKTLFEQFSFYDQSSDPFIHFYETFLSRYNPQKRKSRGVWYTPEPVVNFIVRAVDQVLKTDFKLSLGLADTSRISVDWDTGEIEAKKPRMVKKDVHRVQILDPATGTGTFLAAVIKHIEPKVKKHAAGLWDGYIKQELIPRLHGFELLMASYAMCHMKLEMVLAELGYRAAGDERLSVYLTNSLEEGQQAKSALAFARWLSNESNAASDLKKNMPIMCILGNPPYSGESQNKDKWIMDLMEAYKYEPNSQPQMKLKERNPKWINDDYVKFIRFSEYMIAKNGEGIVGFITNHGYLDNPTFRGMRWHLLNTFDRIYVLDLHGNAKKKEVTPGGTKDENVFDIQQGVAILIAVKTRYGSGLADVRRHDLWGRRAVKYKALEELDLASDGFEKLDVRAPNYFFTRQNYDLLETYEKGFGINDLMSENSVGIVTSRDSLTIDASKDILWKRLNDFVSLDIENARARYNLGNDVRDWRISWAQQDVSAKPDYKKLVPINYRPFDMRWTYFTGQSRGLLCYPRKEIMRHMLAGNNLGLVAKRGNGEEKSASTFVTKHITESRSWSRAGMQGIDSLFPLYLYPDEEKLDLTERTVNMNPEIRVAIKQAAIHPRHGVPDEVAIFDYIYGVLHCPAYRKTYAEFLKTDFPRIPYPANPENFWDISAKGAHLRRLHLMDADTVGDSPYPFEGRGDGRITGVKFEITDPKTDIGRVRVNETQQFSHVSRVAWDFFIGGYQPAQKWLKDRKGQTLDFEDITHYQKIIAILEQTHTIMQTIHLAHES